MVPSRCTRLAGRFNSCFTPHEGGGRLVVLEGVPGAGKTTSVRRLARTLGAVMVPQLDHTQMARTLQHQAAQRWYVSAEVARQPDIRTALAASQDVIQDRNVISTLAFAYAWAGRYRIEQGFVTSVRNILVEAHQRLVRPDVLLLLTVDPSLGLERRRQAYGEPRDEVWRDADFLARHHDFYRLNRSRFPATSVVEIDTTDLTEDELASAIAAEVPSGKRR